MALEDEEDGVFNPKEVRRGEKTEAFQSAKLKAETLRALKQGWDLVQYDPP